MMKSLINLSFAAAAAASLGLSMIDSGHPLDQGETS